MVTWSRVAVVLAMAATVALVNSSPARQEARKEAEMKLTSSAFREGGAIPRKYTGEGEDLSPPLAWSGVPEGARELALLCDDPDAPRPEPWVHWVLYNIPVSATGLAEGIGAPQAIGKLPGAQLGRNSWGKLGYGGPMPPPGHGPHRYYFKLFALSEPVKLKSAAGKQDLLEAIRGKVLAEAQLMGIYERK